MRPGEKVGAMSEARFFNIFDQTTEGTPKWLVEVKRASWRWEMHGIDAFAYIRSKPTSSGTETVLVKVPIQIKSSIAGKAWFARKYSADHVKNIFLFVVEATKSDDHLRQAFYSHLGRIRHQGLVFDEFLSRVRRKKFSRQAEKDVKKKSMRLRHYKG
ncbi:hypothetical protein KKD81_00880 [Patescibacteria group bacterium]|nr:hypothetical protein [Patescibacteria group bacterium]MBU2159058.1 hypothetical protein [Patescibacteria group bacterium]MBU2220473.1 hypothetical protein [Patescibacteria group bacterium]